MSHEDGARHNVTRYPVTTAVDLKELMMDASGKLSLKDLKSTAKARQSLLMSKSLPVPRSVVRTPRADTLHSSQSLTGKASLMTYRHRQFPSASAALNEYISDYEHQNSSSENELLYRRTVSDLLLPPPMLRRTADRSLETGVRDTRNEFHRFNVRKLIDESYEQMLRADQEQEKASTMIEYTERLRSSRPQSKQNINSSERSYDLASEISSSTDALLMADPYFLPGHNNSGQRENMYNLAKSSVRSNQKVNTLTENGHPIRLSAERTNNFRRHDDQSRHRVGSVRHPALHHTRHIKTYGGTEYPASHWREDSSTRPTPAWVSNLDMSWNNPPRISTLYTDSLLFADGHAPLLRQNDEYGLSTSRSHNYPSMQSFSSKDWKDDSSVMSGFRPAPTWVEDLDATADSFQTSLRLLARDMDPPTSSRRRQPIDPGRLHSRSKSSGSLNYRRRDILNTRSNYGSNARTANRNLSQLRQESRARVHKAARNANQNVPSTMRPLHRRTVSASTEDLIKESPFGDPTPQNALQSLPHQDTPNHTLHHQPRLELTKATSQMTSAARPSGYAIVEVVPKHPHAISSHRPAAAQEHPTLSMKSSTLLDDSTATDSLIYSSPFGLDRDNPYPDLAFLPKAYSQPAPTPLTPVHSDGTLQEKDLALSLSSLSLATVGVDGGTMETPLVADHVSESTVGETARANAMLQRAHMNMENTTTSINASSFFEKHDDSAGSSSGTDDLLAGDHNKALGYNRLEDVNSESSELLTRRILEQFGDDHSADKERSDSMIEQQTPSSGPLESLKNMLFKLQDLAASSPPGTTGQQQAAAVVGVGGTRRTRLAQEPRPGVGSKGQNGYLQAPLSTSPISNTTTARSTLSASPLRTQDWTAHSAKSASLDISGGRWGGGSEGARAGARGRMGSGSVGGAKGGAGGGGERPGAITGGAQRIGRDVKGRGAGGGAGAIGEYVSAQGHHDLHPAESTSNVSFRSQGDFDEEQGGQSLKRAMKHLNRLKSLVAMDTTALELQPREVRFTNS